MPKKNQKWIEVIPYGLIGGMAPNISLIVFKEKKGEERFAVCLSQLQSQVAVQQESQKERTFSFLTPLLESLDIYPTQAYFFIDRRSKEPRLEVHFSGSKEFSIVFRARESLAFCIQYKCQFFCTHSFIDNMREIKFDSVIKRNIRSSRLSLN